MMRIVGIGTIGLMALFGSIRSAWAQWGPFYDSPSPMASLQNRVVPSRSWVTGGTANVTPARGSTWVSVSFFTIQQASQRHEWGATAMLAVPLDRRSVERGRFAEPSAERPGGGGEAGDDETLTLPITPIVARLAVAASWKTASLESDEARLGAMLSRARWSAALPETRLRALRTQDDQVRVDTSDDRQRMYDRTGVRLWLEARLTWRLDRILYGIDEASVERIRSTHHDARTRLAHQTLEALFKWQRAWLEQGDAPRGTREGWEAALRLAETAATLDVLTGGWFTRWRKGLARIHTTPEAMDPPP